MNVYLYMLNWYKLINNFNYTFLMIFHISDIESPIVIITWQCYVIFKTLIMRLFFIYCPILILTRIYLDEKKIITIFINNWSAASFWQRLGWANIPFRFSRIYTIYRNIEYYCRIYRLARNFYIDIYQSF